MVTLQNQILNKVELLKMDQIIDGITSAEDNDSHVRTGSNIMDILKDSIDDTIELDVFSSRRQSITSNEYRSKVKTTVDQPNDHGSLAIALLMMTSIGIASQM
jgi:hypothetical protein